MKTQSDRKLLSRIVFGFGAGLWVSSWLSIISPIIPFVAAYPVLFLAMWWMSYELPRGREGRF